MGSELRRKFIVLSLTVIFTSGFVAAQISNGGAGGTPSITGFLDDIAIGVNDAISWDTGDNWESMLLNVILPALGVYAAARFVIGKGFHYAEANFQERSSLGSSDLGETAEWAAKVLSAITAIWAVVAWGAFIAAYWYLAGIVFMIFLLWILITGGIGVMSPFPDLSLSSDSDNSGSGRDVASDGGVTAEVQNEVERDKEELDDAGAKAKDAAQTGNEDEAKEAEREIEDALNSINNVEMKIEQLLEAEENDLQNAIKEAREVIQEERKEEQDIQLVRKRLEEIENILKELEGGMTRYSNAIKNASDPNIGWGEAAEAEGIDPSYVTGSGKNRKLKVNAVAQGWITPSGSGLTTDVVPRVEEIENVAKELRQIEQDEADRIKDEVQRVVREAQRFVQTHKLIQEVKSLINEAEEEDKYLEKVAKKLKNKEIFQKAKEEEEEEKQLESQLKKLMDKEEMIEKELKEAAKLLEEEVRLDLREVKQMKWEIQEIQNIEQHLENLTALSQNIISSTSDLPQKISGIERNLAREAQELGKIEETKENAVKTLEEAEQKVKQAASQLK